MRRSNKVVLSPLVATSSASLAGRAIDFVERYLVLPETRTKMVMHPYQRELFEQWADGSINTHATVIGAGNAKTSTLGAFVTACLFLTDEASVPVVAETITQAVLTTWGKVKRFVELCPELMCRAEILEGQGSRRGVYVPSTNGHCFPIADKPDGLQGLNPGPVAVLEEMSEATVETYAALVNRLGKRAEAKVVGISTPSFTENNALLTLQRSMRSGDPMPGVALTEYISDQTDHRDEGQWHKANPGLLTSPAILGIDAVRTSLAALPEQQFRAYRLCQNPTGSLSCWLNAVDDEGNETGDGYDVWKRGASSFTLREGAPTFVGVDVAKTRDDAAVVWGQHRDDRRLHVKAKIWTPTKTSDIDLEEIADHLRMLCGRFDVQGIGYDPSYFYNAPALARDGLPMIETPPTEIRMAPLTGHCYQAIRQGLVTHDEDDEHFTRHVLAARRRYGQRGFTLEKRQFSQKIDAAVALVLCHGVAAGLGALDDEDRKSVV